MTRLAKQHSDFRHPGLSYLDFKTVEMDRVLTAFLARLRWDGQPSRLARHADLDVDDFVGQLLAQERDGIGFAGFADAPDITRRWVESDLVDVVNRGRATQVIAGLRPLHGATYRYRNSRHSRPYGADEQLYEMLAGAPGRNGSAALRELRDFFFAGLDKATGTLTATGQVDVETQALLHLCAAESAPDDRPDHSRRRPYPPFCPGQAELLADDVLRLLHHQTSMPRSVLIDYLKVLLAFHLALHHLRLIKGLPAILEGTGRHRCRLTEVAEGVRAPSCEPTVGLFVDVAAIAGTQAARLAERSADLWWQRIPGYVRSAFEIKKLDEFGDYLVKRRTLSRSGDAFSVEDAIALGRRRDLRTQRDGFFAARIADLVEGIDAEEMPAELTYLLDLGLDDRDAYLEILSALRGDFHRRYLTDCLDALLLKNRPGAAIAQPRGHPRRFVLDSRLLEVLLQVCLLHDDGGTLRTGELRVDEFLTVLRVRYGVHVDRLPDGEGFETVGVTDHAALRANTRAFTDRLREIGYYSDLSDAYLTQTVRPRYRVRGSVQ